MMYSQIGSNEVQSSCPSGVYVAQYIVLNGIIMCVIAVSFQVDYSSTPLSTTQTIFFHLKFQFEYLALILVLFYLVRLMIRGIGTERNLNLFLNFKWINSLALWLGVRCEMQTQSGPLLVGKTGILNYTKWYLFPTEA